MNTNDIVTASKAYQDMINKVMKVVRNGNARYSDIGTNYVPKSGVTPVQAEKVLRHSPVFAIHGDEAVISTYHGSMKLYVFLDELD